MIMIWFAIRSQFGINSISNWSHWDTNSISIQFQVDPNSVHSQIKPFRIRSMRRWCGDWRYACAFDKIFLRGRRSGHAGETVWSQSQKSWSESSLGLLSFLSPSGHMASTALQTSNTRACKVLQLKRKRVMICCLKDAVLTRGTVDPFWLWGDWVNRLPLQTVCMARGKAPPYRTSQILCGKALLVRDSEGGLKALLVLDSGSVRDTSPVSKTWREFCNMFSKNMKLCFS